MACAAPCIQLKISARCQCRYPKNRSSHSECNAKQSPLELQDCAKKSAHATMICHRTKHKLLCAGCHMARPNVLNTCSAAGMLGALRSRSRSSPQHWRYAMQPNVQWHSPVALRASEAMWQVHNDDSLVSVSEHAQAAREANKNLVPAPAPAVAGGSTSNSERRGLNASDRLEVCRPHCPIPHIALAIRYSRDQQVDRTLLRIEIPCRSMALLNSM